MVFARESNWREPCICSLENGDIFSGARIRENIIWLRFLGFKFLFLVAGKGFLQSSWKYYHAVGFLTDFAHSFLVFSGQLGIEWGTPEIMDKHKEYVTGKQINLQIYKKLLHVFTVTEDGFFASFRTFQYCLPYSFYSRSLTL